MGQLQAARCGGVAGEDQRDHPEFGLLGIAHFDADHILVAGLHQLAKALHVLLRIKQRAQRRIADRPALDLRDLAQDLEGQGIQLPILLRFSDILKRRIENLLERAIPSSRDEDEEDAS